MSRPLPTISRGPKRATSRDGADRVTLRCPALSPEYQFRAFVALIKPQFKPGVAHRSGRQALPRAARRVVLESIANLGPRVGSRVEVRFDRGTADLLTIRFDPRDARRARACALELSARFDNLWFLFNGRLLHGGRFYRRQGRYRLVPVSMRVPRLPRDVFLTMVGASDDAGRREEDDPDPTPGDPDE